MGDSLKKRVNHRGTETRRRGEEVKGRRGDGERTLQIANCKLEIAAGSETRAERSAKCKLEIAAGSETRAERRDKLQIAAGSETRAERSGHCKMQIAKCKLKIGAGL